MEQLQLHTSMLLAGHTTMQAFDDRPIRSFVQIIRNAHTKHGSNGGFSANLAELKSMQARDHIIDWETDPIIFLQIFRGHPECGNWVLAVVDRTA
jgi:hypothetical protein